MVALLSCLPGGYNTNPGSWYSARNSMIMVVDAEEVTVKRGKVLYLGEPFTGQVRTYFDDGMFKSQVDYVDGRKEGLAVKYYHDGNVAESRYYSKGKKTGTHMGWWPSGEIKFAIAYFQSLYHGRYEEWFENRTRYKLFHYNHGEEEGTQQMWKEDGSFRANYVVKNGRRFGLTGTKQCKSLK